MVLKNLEFKIAKDEDSKYLFEWFGNGNILDGFPICNKIEIEDTVKTWLSYNKQKASFIALLDGKVCAMAVIYLNFYKKMKHHALFAIVIAEKYRGKGIGKAFINYLIEVSKKEFHLEFLHLEVYHKNLIAISLYEKMGFEKYGVHKKFLKAQNGQYFDKILMQKKL